MKSQPQKDSSLFDYPAKTTVPAEVGDEWEDRSWYMDGSACCQRKVPAKGSPRAALVLWVQPDDRREWRLPDAKKFQLDYMPDGDAGWDASRGCKTLVNTMDIRTVMDMVKRSL